MLAIFRHQWHGVTRCRLDGIKPQTKPFTSLFTPIAICQIATSGRDWHNKCTPRVHSRLSTKNCEWDVKDTWSRLCLVGLQNVNPQKWVFKKVKVQPRVSKCNWRGTKNIAYISTYNKTKTDAGWRCCLCLLLCTGVHNKTTNFWPRGQNFKILPRLSGRFHVHKCVQKTNLLLVKSK